MGHNSICSTNYHLTNELEHLGNNARYRNSFPHWAVKQILEQVDTERQRNLNSNVNACGSHNNLSKLGAAKVAYATLTYKGKTGEKVSSKAVLKSCSQKKLKQGLFTRVPPILDLNSP